MENQEYRYQLTIRKQSKPVHTSREFRTESYDNLTGLLNGIQTFNEDQLDYDLQQLEDGGGE